MKTIILPILMLLILSMDALAQETEFKASLFKEDKEAFRLAEESLKKGIALADKAMDIEAQGGRARTVWNEALPHLLEAQHFNPKYSRLNYLIARTMEGCDRVGEAASYARQARALDPEVEAYNYFLLARAAHLRLATDSALQFLSMYETKAKSRELESMTTRIRKLRMEIDHARNMTGKPRERVWIENVAGLNSPADELVPNLPADAAFMLFNRSEGEGEASTLMMAERLPGGWGEPEEWLGGQFSGYRVIAISQDGQELFLSSRTTGSDDIYYSELQGIQWSDPRKMPDYKINTEAEETHASFYFDRIKFYFVSDNDYANKGGKD
ncbi:MAG: hypothetical protein IH599_06575, partial [Bacteroidales bacterium]|nr:hypothetical protein [Bacteroidales bacterium]